MTRALSYRRAQVHRQEQLSQSIQGFGHSDNGGTTWTFDQNFPGASSFDKNFSAVDDISGSPFFGRAYTVWTNFGGTFVNRIVMSYSTNGGVTWSTAAPVSPVAGGHHHQGCDVEVGPGGVVYVVWGNCTTNGQNSTEDFLGFAKSNDGGVTWTGVNDNAVDINGIRAASLFNGIRASGFPRLAAKEQAAQGMAGFMLFLQKKMAVFNIRRS